MTRSVTILLVALGCAGCSHVPAAATSAPRAPSASAAVSDRLGYSWMDPKSGLCLATSAIGLPVSTKVTLLWVPVPGDDYPPVMREARVLGAVSDASQMIVTNPGDVFYRIGPQEDRDAGSLYFAIIGEGVAVDLRGSRALADLDGDGTAEAFRMCTSYEGVHLTVRSEPSAGGGEGPTRWHRYFHLGYDVEPTCDSTDTHQGD